MELDEFKQLYKEKAPEERPLHSAGELEGYMRTKTNSVIGKIKRSIRFIGQGVNQFLDCRCKIGGNPPWIDTDALC